MSLEIINLTKKFGEQTALNNVNINIQSNEIIGLLGPNGAGKTTTFRMLIRDIKPTLGEIFINGENIVGKAKNGNDDVEIGFACSLDCLIEVADIGNGDYRVVRYS